MSGEEIGPQAGSIIQEQERGQGSQGEVNGGRHIQLSPVGLLISQRSSVNHLIDQTLDVFQCGNQMFPWLERGFSPAQIWGMNR